MAAVSSIAHTTHKIGIHMSEPVTTAMVVAMAYVGSSVWWSVFNGISTVAASIGYVVGALLAVYQLYVVARNHWHRERTIKHLQTSGRDAHQALASLSDNTQKITLVGGPHMMRNVIIGLALMAGAALAFFGLRRGARAEVPREPVFRRKGELPPPVAKLPAPAKQIDKQAPAPDGSPRWYEAARREIGVVERPGRRNNTPRILEYFKLCGHDEVADDETAWCAAFVGAMLKLSGYAGTGALNARSYLSWGVPLEEPRLGCVVVLKRGDSTWQGHVALYVGPGSRAGYIRLLGGNQSNRVSVAEFPASKVLGYRWVKTAIQSREVVRASVAAAGGAVVAAAVGGPDLVALMGDVSPQIAQIANDLRGMGDFSKWFALAGGLISICGCLGVVFARLHRLRVSGQ